MKGAGGPFWRVICRSLVHCGLFSRIKQASSLSIFIDFLAVHHGLCYPSYFTTSFILFSSSGTDQETRTNQERKALQQHYFNSYPQPSQATCRKWFVQRFGRNIAQSSVSITLGPSTATLISKTQRTTQSNAAELLNGQNLTPSSGSGCEK